LSNINSVCYFIGNTILFVAIENRVVFVFYCRKKYRKIGIVKLTYLTGDKYENMYNRIFRPLFAWFSVQRKAVTSLIIALSKIDTINYNRIKIEQATRIIHSIERFKNVPVCPVSINTLNRESYHILNDKSQKANWFKDEKALDELLKRCVETKSNDHGFFVGYIDTKRKPKKQNKDVLRIRVLRGKLSENDTIAIGPVIITNQADNTPVFLDGLVKSVRPQDPTGSVIELEPGCIGGVAFEKLTHKSSRHSYSLKEVRTNSLSMMFDANSYGVVKGNLLTVKINSKDKEVLQKIKLSADLSLIWFGKFVSVRVVGFHAINDDIYCTLFKTQRSNDEVFVVPVNEQDAYKFLYYKFALQTYDKTLVPVNLKEVSILSTSNDISISITISSQFLLEPEDIANYFKENPQCQINVDSNNKVYVLFDSVCGLDMFNIIKAARNFTNDYQIYNKDIEIRLNHIRTPF